MKSKKILFSIDILTQKRLEKLVKHNGVIQSQMIRDCINTIYAQTFYKKGKR